MTESIKSLRIFHSEKTSRRFHIAVVDTYITDVTVQSFITEFVLVAAHIDRIWWLLSEEGWTWAWVFAWVLWRACGDWHPRWHRSWIHRFWSHFSEANFPPTSCDAIVRSKKESGSSGQRLRDHTCWFDVNSINHQMIATRLKVESSSRNQIGVTEHRNSTLLVVSIASWVVRRLNAIIDDFTITVHFKETFRWFCGWQASGWSRGGDIWWLLSEEGWTWAWVFSWNCAWQASGWSRSGEIWWLLSEEGWTWAWVFSLCAIDS